MSKAVEVQEYKTKNILLEHPADWYIDDQTFDAVQHSLSDIVNFYDNKAFLFKAYYGPPLPPPVPYCAE